MISLHLQNTVGDFCTNKSDEECDELFQFLEDNFKWVMKQVGENPDDSYWHQVKLVLLQFHGLVSGYIERDTFSLEPDFVQLNHAEKRDLFNLM